MSAPFEQVVVFPTSCTLGAALNSHCRLDEARRQKHAECHGEFHCDADFKKKKLKLRSFREGTYSNSTSFVEREVLNDYPPGMWSLMCFSIFDVNAIHRNVGKAVVASSWNR